MSAVDGEHVLHLCSFKMRPMSAPPSTLAIGKSSFGGFGGASSHIFSARARARTIKREVLANLPFVWEPCYVVRVIYSTAVSRSTRHGSTE